MPIEPSLGALPAGANGASLTGFLPMHTSRTLDFNICFYTGFGSLQAIGPSSYKRVSSGAGITFDAPASTIQEVPPDSFLSGSFNAILYTVPTDMPTCTGAAQALGNEAIITLNYPRLTSVSLASTPRRNPNLNTFLPSRLRLTGAYFIGSNVSSAADTSAVTFTSSDTVAGDVSFVSSSSLVSTIPISIPPAATSISVAVCNTAEYSYCAASMPLVLAPLQANSGSVTATPDRATTAQDVTITAKFSPPGISVAGAPGGTVTFEDGNNPRSRALGPRHERQIALGPAEKLYRKDKAAEADRRRLQR